MNQTAESPKFTLLYAILTPVILLPVAVISILLIRGDQAAQFYKEGLLLTTQKKYAEAAEAFRSAGAQGHAESYCCLAELYRSGALKAEDPAHEVWVNLERAALNGSVQAEYELGLMAEKAPQTDYAKSALYYRRAALNGHPAAQLAMGKYYEHGLGVNKSAVLAAEFYSYAVRQGLFNANAALAALYLSGELGKVDYEKARQILIPAIKANHAHSCTLMGYICENAQPDDEESRQLAGVYYRRARNLGDAEGAVNYGDWLIRHKRVSEALDVYKFAAEKQNFAPAKHRLGVHCCSANPPDYRQALKYFESAAAQGYAASWINLGIMAEQGQGGKIDLTRARECYGMAEKLGHPQAAEYLKKFTRP